MACPILPPKGDLLAKNPARGAATRISDLCLGGIPLLLFPPLAMFTIRYPSVWIAKVAAAFSTMPEKPWALFVLLFCVNTLAHPYAGITHDSRLYSVQVLNRVEEGTYAEDLFFRYGSQDEYSLFSRLAAPLVRV